MMNNVTSFWPAVVSTRSACLGLPEEVGRSPGLFFSVACVRLEVLLHMYFACIVCALSGLG